MKPKSRYLRHSAFSAAICLTLASAAHAATYVWDGSGANNSFSNADNWVDNTWAQWNDYEFSGDPTTGTVNADVYHGWGNITLASGLTKDIVINGTQPINMAPASGWSETSLGGTVTIDTASKDLTVNTSFAMVGTLNLNVGAERTLTANGAVYQWFGSSALNKLGEGTAILTAGNSYGATTISAGTLQLSGSGTLGTGGVTLTGGTLNLGGTTQTLGGNLNAAGAGNGAVGTITNGTLNLNGKNAYLKSGTFTMDLNGGGDSRLWIGGDATATVNLGGINTSTYSDSNSTIIGFTAATGAAGTVKLLSATALGPVSQATQVHTGTLDLNGQTGVSVGQISLFKSSNLVNSNTSTAASFGGTVDLTNVTTHNIGGAGDMTLSGVLQSGGFTKTGAGTLTLSGTSNTYSGGTTVSAGVLSIAGTGSLPGWDTNGSYSVASGATLAVGNAVTDGNVATMLGTTNFAAGASIGFDTAAGDRTYSTAIANTAQGALGLTKIGDNKLTIDGANTYTGTTTISAGTLQVGAGSTTGNLGSGAVTNNGTLAFNRSDAITVSNAISGTGSLTKDSAGTLTLTGTNTYTGATTVNSGTLKLQTGSTPILTDNFTATGTPDTGNLNYNLSGRQSGTAATQSWTKTGNAQVGNATNVGQPDSNADYLLLAFGAQAKLTGLELSSSTVSGPLKINFDMFKGTVVNTDQWTSFSLTGDGDGWPVAGSGEVGFLYRKSTGIQIFNNGGAMESFSSTPGGDSFAFYLADSAGTGSAFAGNGARLIVTQGGSILGSYALNTGMGSSIIAFGTALGTGDNAIIGGVDNLGVNNFKTNVLAPTTDVSLTASGATLELEGVIQTVASLSGASGSEVKLGPFSQLKVDGATSTSFDGVISGTLGGLTKSGTGTLTLSSTNTYTGVTTVSGGTLIINGNNSAAIGAVSIASGATLGGTGTVGGATTISGTHAPGNSPGVQSFSGDLSYASTSIFEWDIASSDTGSRSTQYDGVNVGGTLSGTTGATFKVNLNSGAFTDTFWNTSRTWTDIFKAGVDGSGSALNIASVFSNITWYQGATKMTDLTGTEGSFTINGSSLTWTAVPEPTSALAGLLIAAGLLRRRR